MTFLLVLALSGLLGAIAGSFLATILVRWPQGASASTGRSRCDSCQTGLPPAALIPLLSFAWQKGRCHRCSARIAREHPAMEMGGLLVGVTSAVLFTDAVPLAVASALFGWILLLLATFDWQHFWLPDRLTATLAASGLLANLLGSGPGLQDALIGAVAGWAGLVAVAAAYRTVRGREGLGGGDPKMFGAVGAWLGWQALPQVLLAAAGIGLILALVARVRHGPAVAPAQLPLGTLMALAAWPLWLVARLT